MKLLLKNIPLLLLRRVRMRKIIAIAFILFMFASTTTALAGANKRFCGFVTTSAGSGNTTIAIGWWVKVKPRALESIRSKECYSVRQRIKDGLIEQNLWDAYNWARKDLNRCKKFGKNYFGHKVCKQPNYMHRPWGWFLLKKVGSNPTRVIENIEGPEGLKNIKNHVIND